MLLWQTLLRLTLLMCTLHVRLRGCNGLQQEALHGENHPAVNIRVDNAPLVYVDAGEMELRVVLTGALPGFSYRVVVHELDWSSGGLKQSNETIHAVGEDGLDNEVTTRLAASDANTHRFSIAVHDAYEGLPLEESLVARRDLTLKGRMLWDKPHVIPPSVLAQRKLGDGRNLCLIDGECFNSMSNVPRYLAQHDDSNFTYDSRLVDSQEAACLARAQFWHQFCRNSPSSPMTASFVPTAASLTFPHADAASPKWVILLHVTDGYLDFFDNFWRHYTRIKEWTVAHVVKLIVGSDATASYIRRMYGDKIEIGTSTDFGAQAFGFFEHGFTPVVQERAELILRELVTGRNVLYLDIDIALLADPFPFLTPGLP
jgi:hypothetical protein